MALLGLTIFGWWVVIVVGLWSIVMLGFFLYQVFNFLNWIEACVIEYAANVRRRLGWTAHRPQQEVLD